MTILVTFVGVLTVIVWWSLARGSARPNQNRTLIGITAALGAGVLVLVAILSLVPR